MIQYCGCSRTMASKEYRKPVFDGLTAGAEYQDSQYGKGYRVFNKCKPQNGKYTEARCTICNRTVPLKSEVSEKPEAKKKK